MYRAMLRAAMRLRIIVRALICAYTLLGTNGRTTPICTEQCSTKDWSEHVSTCVIASAHACWVQIGTHAYTHALEHFGTVLRAAMRLRIIVRALIHRRYKWAIYPHLYRAMLRAAMRLRIIVNSCMS